MQLPRRDSQHITRCIPVTLAIDRFDALNDAAARAWVRVARWSASGSRAWNENVHLPVNVEATCAARIRCYNDNSLS
jgi:hypothetical protein